MRFEAVLFESNMTKRVRFYSVEPSEPGLITQPIRVRGRCLPAQQRVTLRTQLVCEKNR
jgi:hypothetical protein